MYSIEKPVHFINDQLVLLDQRKLPHEEIFIEINSYQGTHDAIKDMVVRGAPCIGFTAIFGFALGIKSMSEFNKSKLQEIADYLKASRPTAVNLNFEIDECLKIVSANNDQSQSQLYEKIVNYGFEQLELSEKRNRAMALHAEADLAKRLGEKPYNILTHCNTGFLACGSIGTALGVVQNLAEKNKIKKVWVDETRPYLQGSRLTAYELSKLNIDHQIVVEGAASYLMRNKLVDAIFTGADRIVQNGDTANKVGTSNLAILAKHYGIPFYIVAPVSSFDMSLESGEEIPIELRDPKEILEVKEIRIAPHSSEAFNPSFDITAGDLITGIISENGVATGDYKESLKEIL